VEISWHNLARVKPLYKEILGITLEPSLMSEILIAVIKRHDIVHRNGRSKNGTELSLTKEQATQLVDVVKRFVNKIEEDWQEINTPF
jgi:hypothetical protein